MNWICKQCCNGLDKFKETLDRAKELNASVRDYVRKNAEKAFDILEKEEEKRQ